VRIEKSAQLAGRQSTRSAAAIRRCDARIHGRSDSALALREQPIYAAAKARLVTTPPRNQSGGYHGALEKVQEEVISGSQQLPAGRDICANCAISNGSLTRILERKCTQPKGCSCSPARPPYRLAGQVPLRHQSSRSKFSRRKSSDDPTTSPASRAVSG